MSGPIRTARDPLPNPAAGDVCPVMTCHGRLVHDEAQDGLRCGGCGHFIAATSYLVEEPCVKCGRAQPDCTCTGGYVRSKSIEDCRQRFPQGGYPFKDETCRADEAPHAGSLREIGEDAAPAPIGGPLIRGVEALRRLDYMAARADHCHQLTGEDARELLKLFEAYRLALSQNIATTAEVEQLRVQLAGCLCAAEGHFQEVPEQGAYGWSPAYEAVKELRRGIHPDAAHLWQLLDDISTLDDACKERDAEFRRRAYQIAERRTERGIASEDGQTLVRRAPAKPCPRCGADMELRGVKLPELGLEEKTGDSRLACTKCSFDVEVHNYEAVVAVAQAEVLPRSLARQLDARASDRPEGAPDV